MAILKIAKMGHPALRRPALPIDDPTSPEVRKLAADMLETLFDIGGAGLAAPQVHVSLRLVMFQIPEDEEEGDEDGGDDGDEEDGAPQLTILANPVIEPLGAEREAGWEGCLSVPGLRGLVSRPSHIRYAGTGLDGKSVRREARGFHARVVQHECDHLDGILYPQRMDDMSKLIFESEFRHYPPPDES